MRLQHHHILPLSHLDRQLIQAVYPASQQTIHHTYSHKFALRPSVVRVDRMTSEGASWRWIEPIILDASFGRNLGYMNEVTP